MRHLKLYYLNRYLLSRIKLFLLLCCKPRDQHLFYIMHLTVQSLLNSHPFSGL